MDSGISVWVPVISTLAGGALAGCVALLVSRLNHRYAREREETAAAERLRNEKLASEEKLARERYFIATELVFLLEQFGEGTVPVAEDYGHEDEAGYTRSNHRMPVIDFTGVSGDWRTLPPHIMFRIRELAVTLTGVNNLLSDLYDADDEPEYDEYFHHRRFHAARLGLKAFCLAGGLRKECGLPVKRGGQDRWFSFRHLWKLYRRYQNINRQFRKGPMVLSHYIYADRSGN